MSLTYPGLHPPKPPLSTKERAAATKRAVAILEVLNKGVLVLNSIDVFWLYDHTGYPRYTKSAKFMADRIVEVYRLDLITDRLTS